MPRHEFYLCAFGHRSILCLRLSMGHQGASILLLAAIVPITIAANFVRVIALVLITYYGGIDLLEGALHGLTGLGLFAIAVALLVLFDGFLGLCSSLFAYLRGSFGSFNFQK